MSNLQAKFEAILDDVNQEDGVIITTLRRLRTAYFF